MSKVGIEVSVNTNKFDNFIKDFSELGKKYDLDIDIDEEKGIISINILDLLSIETAPILPVNSESIELLCKKQLKYEKSFLGGVAHEKKMDK